MASPLLEVENLEFAYPAAPRLLAGISFSIFYGENVELAGQNGSGKTTLFRCLTGLEKNCQGTIRFDGQKIHSEKDFQKLRKSVCYSLQRAEDQLFFPTVLEDITFGPLNLGLDSQSAQKRALEALGSLGISDFAGRISYNLSGGQQKLVALAAVLAMRPRLLLLDEPLTGLDSLSAGRLLDVLTQLDCAKIVVSHDGGFFKDLFSRRLVLDNGELKESPC